MELADCTVLSAFTRLFIATANELFVLENEVLTKLLKLPVLNRQLCIVDHGVAFLSLKEIAVCCFVLSKVDYSLHFVHKLPTAVIPTGFSLRGSTLVYWRHDREKRRVTIYLVSGALNDEKDFEDVRELSTVAVNDWLIFKIITSRCSFGVVAMQSGIHRVKDRLKTPGCFPVKGPPNKLESTHVVHVKGKTWITDEFSGVYVVENNTLELRHDDGVENGLIHACADGVAFLQETQAGYVCNIMNDYVMQAMECSVCFPADDFCVIDNMITIWKQRHGVLEYMQFHFDDPHFSNHGRFSYKTITIERSFESCKLLLERDELVSVVEFPTSIHVF